MEFFAPQQDHDTRVADDHRRAQFKGMSYFRLNETTSCRGNVLVSGVNDRRRLRNKNVDTSLSVKARRASTPRDTRAIMCPFYAFDPVKHSACARLRQYRDVSRIKQHLKQSHRTDAACTECRGKLEAVHDRYGRLQVTKCGCGGDSYGIQINDEQQAKLSKKSAPNLSNSDKWYRIFSILFPNARIPASPYFSDLIPDCTHGIGGMAHTQAMPNPLLRWTSHQIEQDPLAIRPYSNAICWEPGSEPTLSWTSQFSHPNQMQDQVVSEVTTAPVIHAHFPADYDFSGPSSFSGSNLSAENLTQWNIQSSEEFRRGSHHHSSHAPHPIDTSPRRARTASPRSASETSPAQSHDDHAASDDDWSSITTDGEDLSISSPYEWAVTLLTKSALNDPEFGILFEEFLMTNGRQHQQTSNQGSAQPNSGRSTSGNNPQTPQSTGSHKRKRPSNDRGEDGKNGKSRLSCEKAGSDISLRPLACHFCKRDPVRYMPCFTCNKFDTNHRIKQHLRLKHVMPIHCPRCLQTYDNHADRDTHIQEVDCVRTSERMSRLDGIDQDTMEKLSKKLSKDNTREENWFVIWYLLFPDNTRPDDPYLPESLADDLQPMQEYFLKQYRPLVLSHAKAKGLNVEQVERDFGDILNRALVEMFEMYGNIRLDQSFASPTSHTIKSGTASTPCLQHQEILTPTTPWYEIDPLVFLADQPNEQAVAGPWAWDFDSNSDLQGVSCFTDPSAILSYAPAECSTSLLGDSNRFSSVDNDPSLTATTDHSLDEAVRAIARHERIVMD